MVNVDAYISGNAVRAALQASPYQPGSPAQAADVLRLLLPAILAQHKKDVLRELNERACLDYGHDYTPVLHTSNPRDPLRFYCDRCGHSWDVIHVDDPAVDG